MPTHVTHGGDSRPNALIRLVTKSSEPSIDLTPEETDALNRPEFGREPGDIAEVFPAGAPRTILLGIGKGDIPRQVRNASARLFLALEKRKIEVAHFADANLDPKLGQIIGEGLQAGAGPYRLFPGTVTNSSSEYRLSVRALEENFDKALQRGIQVGRATNLCRELANTPPNIATPGWMAEQARQMAEEFGSLTVELLEGDQLAKEQMVGHINVGRASANPPCVIVIRYQPADSSGKPVVLLGKTITYDTGGLSIKSKTGMPGMKFDKSGGCAVIGAMMACADVVKPNFPVTGILVAAENSISSDAYRPDDVITYRNGVTVEVTNTDAEGRLVLADGLCLAADREDPACIVDIATLTGGIVTALGSVMGGLYCGNPTLRERLIQAGTATGEPLWHMPLNEEYRDMMKSGVADIVNSVPGGNAHPGQGAAFLSYFCPDEIPYAHIDMAGMTHFEKSDFGIEGPSGYGVGLFAEFLGAWGGK